MRYWSHLLKTRKRTKCSSRSSKETEPCRATCIIETIDGYSQAENKEEQEEAIEEKHCRIHSGLEEINSNWRKEWDCRIDERVGIHKLNASHVFRRLSACFCHRRMLSSRRISRSSYFWLLEFGVNYERFGWMAVTVNNKGSFHSSRWTPMQFCTRGQSLFSTAPFTDHSDYRSKNLRRQGTTADILLSVDCYLKNIEELTSTSATSCIVSLVTHLMAGRWSSPTSSI